MVTKTYIKKILKQLKEDKESYSKTNDVLTGYYNSVEIINTSERIRIIDKYSLIPCYQHDYSVDCLDLAENTDLFKTKLMEKIVHGVENIIDVENEIEIYQFYLDNN